MHAKGHMMMDTIAHQGARSCDNGLRPPSPEPNHECNHVVNWAHDDEHDRPPGCTQLRQWAPTTLT